MNDDLISRKTIKSQIETIRDCWSTSPFVSSSDMKLYAETFNVVLQIISDCHIAFNKENVIEELENLKAQYFITIVNAGDEMLGFAYKYVWNALNHAIEIVEKGGIE